MIRSRILTHAFAAATTVVAFVTEPVPGLDEIIVVPMQYTLAGLIALARFENPLNIPFGRASLIIFGGVGVRFVSETLLRGVPLVGMTANAFLTLASTEILGHYVDSVLDREAAAAAEKPSAG